MVFAQVLDKGCMSLVYGVSQHSGCSAHEGTLMLIYIFFAEVSLLTTVLTKLIRCSICQKSYTLLVVVTEPGCLAETLRSVVILGDGEQQECP